MNCETARVLMATNDPGLAEHMASCPACLVRTHAPYYGAPPGLEQRIRRSLQGEAARPVPWRSLALAAALLLAASASFNVVLLRSRPPAGEVLAQDLLSAHIRSLAGTHLLDVPSTDQHTVKPWFNGKLDFSPLVKEVAGFPLLGGRMEYLEGHPAAALVYGRRSHVINLFTWPATAVPRLARTSNGYHLRCWNVDGMDYCALSDLGEAELAQFIAGFSSR